MVPDIAKPFQGRQRRAARPRPKRGARQHRGDPTGIGTEIARGTDRSEVGLHVRGRVSQAMLLRRVRGAPLVMPGMYILPIGVVGPHLAAEVLHRQAGERLPVDSGCCAIHKLIASLPTTNRWFGISAMNCGSWKCPVTIDKV